MPVDEKCPVDDESTADGADDDPGAGRHPPQASHDSFRPVSKTLAVTRLKADMCDIEAL